MRSVFFREAQPENKRPSVRKKLCVVNNRRRKTTLNLPSHKIFPHNSNKHKSHRAMSQGEQDRKLTLTSSDKNHGSEHVMYKKSCKKRFFPPIALRRVLITIDQRRRARRRRNENTNDIWHGT